MSYKKILNTLFIVCIFWVSGQAQQGAIFGTVNNSLTSDPIENALVTCRRDTGPIDSLFTDSMGEYEFDSLQIQMMSTRYTVVASMAGYVSDSQEVNLTNSSPVDTADFNLVPIGSLPLLYTFDGAIINDRRPEFKWKPVSGATSYNINVDTNTAFTSPIISIPVGDTVYLPLVDLDLEKYYWRVSSNLAPTLFSLIDSLIIDTTTPVLFPKLNKSNILTLSIHPNPFINSTKISFTLPKTTMFTMEIFSMDGTLVRTLFGKNSAGQHFIVWDGMDNNGKNLGAGAYLLRLTAGNVLNRKLMLLR